MKKIVCITDFSEISDNAVQYSAQLAKDTEAKLVLLWLKNKAHAQKISVPAGVEEEDFMPDTRLAETCDMLQGVWGIRCDYKALDDLPENAEEVLDSDVQLVTMGIESPANHTPYKLFTSIDFKMVRETNVPVLLVPGNFRYRKLQRILYTFDYAHEENPPLGQLERLSAWLHADVRVLAVSKADFSGAEEAEIDNRNSELLAKWNGSRTISFDSIYYHDVAQCLEHYLELWRADDIIIFSIGHPSLVERIFHKSVIQQMTLCCEYPMMIIHKP
jgi:hypothetical protein